MGLSDGRPRRHSPARLAGRVMAGQERGVMNKAREINRLRAQEFHLGEDWNTAEDYDVYEDIYLKSEDYAYHCEYFINTTGDDEQAFLESEDYKDHLAEFITIKKEEMLGR